MSALASARIGIELLRGRFETFLAETPSDLAACVELVDEVRRDELRRVVGESSLETSGFSEDGAEGIVLAVRERSRGTIVGCVRGIYARSVAHQPQVHREYRLDLVPDELVERTGIAARMVVAPEYRKSAASLVLVRGLYELSVRDLGLLLFCVSCEPALLWMYQHLGYRPVAHAWAKPSGGFRVPTMLVGHDEEHLRRVRSPLLPVLRQLPRPWPDAAVQWFRDHPEIPARSGVRPWSPRNDHPALRQLTAGLSAAGRRALLQHAVEVEAQPGDVVFQEGDGVHGLAVVLEGGVRTQSRGVELASLGAGEVLGTVCATLEGPRLFSSVVERPGTRLLLLSRTALGRVQRAADRAILWRTLARTIAEQVARMHVEPVPAESPEIPSTRSDREVA